MKKRFVAAFVLSTAVLMAGCGKQEEEVKQEEKTEEVVTLPEETETEEAETETEEAETETVEETETEAEEVQDPDMLPGYFYPGPELFYTTLYDYVLNEIGQYMDGEVIIPDVMITDMDESDKSDIKVYGDFACYSYKKNGDTLVLEAGGSFPGLIHVKTNDDGYEVTSMDRTDDGAGFDESVKKIFGDKADNFSKMYADDKEKERIRLQIIANYVAANSLDIKFAQDTEEPVELPAENIDSFYSTDL